MAVYWILIGRQRGNDMDKRKKANLYAVLLGIGSLLSLFHPAKAIAQTNPADDLKNIGGDFQRAMQKAQK